MYDKTRELGAPLSTEYSTVNGIPYQPVIRAKQMLAGPSPVVNKEIVLVNAPVSASILKPETVSL